MIQTVSILLDEHHFLYPKLFLCENCACGPPGWVRRIKGVMLVALATFLTFGVVTAFYLYWAYRKVAHTGKQGPSELEERVEGEVDNRKEGLAQEEVMKASPVPFASNEVQKEIELSEMTGLHLYRDPKVVSDLIESGESVEKQNIEGRTPLFTNQSLEAVKILVNSGAKCKNSKGQTPLHHCINPEIASYLIDHFGKEILNHADEDGCTPIFINQNLKVVEILIERGAKIDCIAEKFQWTPLFFTQNVEIAKLLVDKGLDPNFENCYGQTALYGCISPEVAKWLVDERRLDPHKKDSEGLEPIHYLGEKEIELAKVLIGNRGSGHDWGEKVPAVLNNAG